MPQVASEGDESKRIQMEGGRRESLLDEEGGSLAALV
jgi:hypothetical protein